MSIGFRLVLSFFAAIFFGMAIYAIRTGVFNIGAGLAMPLRAAVYRNKEPLWFWFIVFVYVFGGFLLLLTAFADYFFFFLGK